MTIPVSVIVAVRDEEKKIAACLAALKDFDEIVVVDSQSRDRTADMARANGAAIVDYVWDRQYPKKRQWCLDRLDLKHEWIFFVDADEIVTADLIEELKRLFADGPNAQGYFIRARYMSQGKILRHGWPNNKLILFNRREMEFPVVDDLDIPSMGEIEGHYQPVGKMPDVKIGQLSSFLLHDALDDGHAWVFRHKKYARWEAGMNRKHAWPRDPKKWRETAKRFLRSSQWRPQIVFFMSFVVFGGFLDGQRGLDFARRKMEYYALIAELSRSLQD